MQNTGFLKNRRLANESILKENYYFDEGFFKDFDSDIKTKILKDLNSKKINSKFLDEDFRFLLLQSMYFLPNQKKFNFNHFKFLNFLFFFFNSYNFFKILVLILITLFLINNFFLNNFFFDFSNFGFNLNFPTKL
jgi:hypothetical protein